MFKKSLLLLAIFAIGSGSSTYTSYVPILMDRDKLETSVSMVALEKPINNPGKLCLYKHWILLVETYKGIHFIDNLDPSNPRVKGFLNVPGCSDVTVRNDVVYANNAVDLVGVKVDFDALTAELLTRQKSLLPEVVDPNGELSYRYTSTRRSPNTVIVGWLSVESSSDASSNDLNDE